MFQQLLRTGWARNSPRCECRACGSASRGAIGVMFSAVD